MNAAVIAYFLTEKHPTLEDKMRAYQVRQFGLNHLAQVELPMLQIAPGMVLIKVRAVSLNYRDLMVVKG